MQDSKGQNGLNINKSKSTGNLKLNQPSIKGTKFPTNNPTKITDLNHVD